MYDRLDIYVHINNVNIVVYILYRRHKADERGALLHRHHLHHALKYLHERKREGGEKEDGSQDRSQDEGGREGDEGGREGDVITSS